MPLYQLFEGILLSQHT